MQEGIEATGELVMARRKSTKRLEPVEESLDEVSCPVAMPVGLALGRAVAPRRDARLGTRGFNGFDQGVAVVSLVSDDSPGWNGRHQRGASRYIGLLSTGQDRTQRITQRIDTGVALSG
jgi:hypothetical protein